MITLEKIKKLDKKLGVQSVQRKQYCEEHDDEVLKLFCKTCNKVICRDCALVKHREHDYSFIREVRPETRNQLELLLKKVEEKESEFQDHKNHVEGLQRSNEDTLNSCLKDVNEMCDKLIEVIESRRAYLVAKLHRKHEAGEEQNKGEMNSIDLSLVRLSDSIRFTRKLLDDGNDVELMTVGMQAKEALEGLSTMEWNRNAVRPSLLRLKFASAVEDMKTFGKVLNTIQSSDILVENVPHNACVGDKLEFNVKLFDEIATRQYDAAALLSVTVTHNERKIPVAIQNNDLNNWNISCTPRDGGEHSIVIQFEKFASQSHKFVAEEGKDTGNKRCKEIAPAHACDAYETRWFPEEGCAEQSQANEDYGELAQVKEECEEIAPAYDAYPEEGCAKQSQANEDYGELSQAKEECEEIAPAYDAYPEEGCAKQSQANEDYGELSQAKEECKEIASAYDAYPEEGCDKQSQANEDYSELAQAKGECEEIVPGPAYDACPEEGCAKQCQANKDYGELAQTKGECDELAQANNTATCISCEVRWDEREMDYHAGKPRASKKTSMSIMEVDTYTPREDERRSDQCASYAWQNGEDQKGTIGLLQGRSSPQYDQQVCRPSQARKAEDESIGKATESAQYP